LSDRPFMRYADRKEGAENFLKDRHCRDERKQWGSKEKKGRKKLQKRNMEKQPTEKREAGKKSRPRMEGGQCIESQKDELMQEKKSRE